MSFRPARAMDAVLQKLNMLAQESKTTLPLPPLMKPTVPARAEGGVDVDRVCEGDDGLAGAKSEIQRAAKTPLDPSTIALNRQRIILSKMVKTMTKNGHSQDGILARVAARLSVKYGRPDALAVAIDAVRPVLRYHREPVLRKSWYPLALPEASSIGLGIRWVLANADAKEYYANAGVRRRDLERALEEELEAIIEGTSALYTKKFHFHKNPN